MQRSRLSLLAPTIALISFIACSGGKDDTDDDEEETGCVQPVGPTKEETCGCISELLDWDCEPVWDACDMRSGWDAAACKEELAGVYGCGWVKPENDCDLSIDEICGCVRDDDSRELCASAWGTCDQQPGADGRNCKLALQQTFNCD